MTGVQTCALPISDDLNIAFKDQSNLEKGAQILNTVFKRFKLEINLRKTKTVIFNFYEANLEYPESILSLDEVRIDNVREFKYLGSKVQFNEPGTLDSDSRHWRRRNSYSVCRSGDTTVEL